jgi:hypothetical protein
MTTISTWEVLITVLLAGALLIGLSLLLLTEYRKAFFADPPSVMSFDVLAEILGTYGSGYTAVFAFFIGCWFSFGALGALAGAVFL